MKNIFVPSMNLELLAIYLENLPDDYDKFQMYTFLDAGEMHRDNDFSRKDAQDEYLAKLHTCGSAACAVGHGPSLYEVDKVFKVKRHEGWSEYTARVFGIDDCDDGEGERAFNWLFDGEWGDVDNTPKGAAKRIRWYLKKGVPENADAQLYGTEPLCYK